ncbi:MAG: hemolysin family protein [Myxococcota bacterium]
MPSVFTELITIFALVLANGFFAGAEIAIVALRKSRIQELADEGRSSARAVLALRDDPEGFLATVQVGITVVSATAAAFGGESIAKRLAEHLRPVHFIGEHAHGVALALVIAVLSYLSIVIGELVPKSLALRGAERYALLVGRPIRALSWLTRPLVWILGSSANLVLRPFGDRTTFTETRHSAEELQELVEEAAKAGVIHPEAGEIAARALELPDLTVADVMVPRHAVVAIPRNASRDELRRILLEQTHTRIPVYEGRIDNVVGYVSVKDMLALAWDQKLIVLEDILRTPYFVPDTKQAVELLKEMRARHMPFAVVVDEQGGMAGIVTMEDVLEELVGEIFSEHERDVPELIKRETDGAAILDGLASIRAVNRKLDVELPENGPWTTVAGLCLALSGRIPTVGDVLEVPGGITLEVLDATPRRIRSVRLRTPPATPAEV